MLIHHSAHVTSVLEWLSGSEAPSSDENVCGALGGFLLWPQCSHCAMGAAVTPGHYLGLVVLHAVCLPARGTGLGVL